MQVPHPNCVDLWFTSNWSRGIDFFNHSCEVTYYTIFGDFYGWVSCYNNNYYNQYYYDIFFSGDYSFSGFNSLTQIVLTSGLVQIGPGAQIFQYSAVKSLTIPSSVTAIGGFRVIIIIIIIYIIIINIIKIHSILFYSILIIIKLKKNYILIIYKLK